MEAIEFTEYSEYFGDSDFIVCIDPGHGGMVDGIYDTAPNKMYKHPDFTFYEGVYNRNIANYLASFLREANISHIFSTNSNLDVSLELRVNRWNNYVKVFQPGKEYLYLSIHGNAAPKGIESATGIEVYTSPGLTPSDPYADIIYKNLETMNWKMRKDIADGDYDKEAAFYVLQHTVTPAVLVELGFYTNYEEARLMMKDATQWLFADKLFNSILECKKLEENGKAEHD